MFIGEGPKEKFEPTVSYSNNAFLRKADGSITNSKGEVFGLYARTGQRLINKIIKKTFYREESIEKLMWLTNCIKCSHMERGKLGKPSNCLHFIEKEIQIINPNLIILLGSKARDIIGKKMKNYKEYIINIGGERKIINSKHPSRISNTEIEKLIQCISSNLE